MSGFGALRYRRGVSRSLAAKRSKTIRPFDDVIELHTVSKAPVAP